MTGAKRNILNTIQAVISIYLLYNISFFQNLIEYYKLNNFCIIIFLITGSFIFYIILQIIIRKYIVYKFDVSLNNARASIYDCNSLQTLKDIKKICFYSEFYSYYGNLLFNSLVTDDEDKFFKTFYKKPNKKIKFLFSIMKQPMIILSVLFVLYMRTDILSKILSKIKEIIIKQYSFISKLPISVTLLCAFVTVISIFFYIGIRNRLKMYSRNFDRKIEERLINNINEFISYLNVSINIIIRNLYNLIYCLGYYSNKQRIMTLNLLDENDEPIYEEVRYGSQIRGLLGYFKNNRDSQYFLKLCISHKKFMFFYLQLTQGSFYTCTNHVLDILFNTQNYVDYTFFNNNDVELDLYTIATEIIEALIYVYKLSNFMDDYIKYTKISFLEENIKYLLNKIELKGRM